MSPQKQQVGFSLRMGFSWFFPCSVWGGREPTAALADKTQGGISARNTLLRGIIRQKKPKKRAACRFIQGIMRNLRRESANERVKRLFTY